MKFTEREEKLLAELRKMSEGCEDLEEGNVWREVYLDNVSLRTEDPRAFAALTGSLTKKGYYRPIDEAFANVRMS